MVWLWLDLRARRTEGAIEYYFSFHQFTATFLLGVLTLLVVFNFFDVNELKLLNRPDLKWLAILSVVTLMTACLWDRYAKYAVAGLYILGLVACATALQRLELSATRFVWSATLILSAYTLLTALAWHWRHRIINFTRQFQMPERINAETTQLNWLFVFTTIVVVTIGILAYGINLTFVEVGLRATAAVALMAQFLTFGLLAEGKRAEHWRRAAIVVAVIGAVFVGWTWLTPNIRRYVVESQRDLDGRSVWSNCALWSAAG